MWVKTRLNQGAKSLYMTLVSFMSKRVRDKDKKQEIAYLLSFPGNDRGLIEQLAQEKELGEVIIYYTKACQSEAKLYREIGLTCIDLDDTATFFKSTVSRITQSRVIICDNYFAFLGALELSKETVVFQIWHANGAIKTFGWQDTATVSRSKADRRRFQAVYDAVDYYVVGSDKMGKVFEDSYHISEDKLLKIGCPRTDRYFNEGYRRKAKEKFSTKFPELAGKTKILYVPTYRPYETAELEAMLSKIALPENTIGFGHLHPHMSEIEVKSSFSFDLRGLSLEEMLYNVDILITDYSSVPFEYGLINPDGKVLFYCPDVRKYEEQVGLQFNFSQEAKESRVTTIEALEQKLERNDGINARQYAESWNEYNDGQATSRLIEYLKTM